MKKRAIVALLGIGMLAGVVLAQPRKLKVYIAVDMEGVVGTVTGDQLGPAGFEYARFREFMSHEALAAVNAAKESGATEILVADSHGNGENLLIEMFPPDVRIIRSWPRHLGMMAGLDATFDGAIFIGFHASTNNPQGVRAHTFSSARFTRVAVNGTNFSEGAWGAAIAGHFGVPVVMISGDDAAIAEVRALVGNIEAAEVKRALSFHSANTVTPAASYELIRQKVKSALGRLPDFKPFRVTSPVTVEIGFKHYTPVEVLGFLKMFERVDSHTIRYRAKDMIEAADILEFLSNYSVSLEP